MPTKEEILSENEYDVHYYGGGRKNILEAMQVYSDQQNKELKEIVLQLQKDFVLKLDEVKKQEWNLCQSMIKTQSIQFKEWEDSSLEEKRWENYDGHDTWINPHTRKVISTSELYSIFLEQSK